MADAVGPQVGKMHEEGDKRRAELLYDEAACSVSERLDCPADDVLQESLRIVFAQTRTVTRSAFYRRSLSVVHAFVPIPVELDDKRQGSIEPDIVLAVGDQALGQLPSFRGPLQTVKHLLDLGDGLGRIWLIERPNQLPTYVSLYITTFLFVPAKEVSDLLFRPPRGWLVRAAAPLRRCLLCRYVLTSRCSR